MGGNEKGREGEREYYVVRIVSTKLIEVFYNKILKILKGLDADISF